jgi:ComF family protein
MDARIARRSLGWVTAAVRSTVDFVYPPACLACEEIDDGLRHGLCASCRDALPRIRPPACPRCGEPRRRPATGRSKCGACPRGSFAPDGAVAALRYEGIAKDLVLGLKFGRDRLLARPLAAAVVERLRAPDVFVRPDVIVPVPLAFRRRLSRGFNQAADVARLVARDLGVPCRTHLVRRRATPAQSGLSRSARRRNVRGAFTPWPWAERWLRGRTVLIVDDVLTTGATVDALARALRGARPRSVWIAAAARATSSS